MTSMLVEWGDYVALNTATQGYPVESSIVHIFSGGRARPGAKILIFDPPPRVWRIDRIVQSLPPALRDVLIVHYALPPNEDNTQKTVYQCAQVLRISARAYERRLSRAHRGVKKGLAVSG